MENIKTPVEEIIDDLKEYVEISVDLYKLKATEKGAQLGASLISNLAIMLTICMALLFVSLSLAFLLGAVWNNLYLGFLAIAGVYVILGLILAATRDSWLKNKLVNNFVKSIYAN